jgi:hypothetical protein
MRDGLSASLDLLHPKRGIGRAVALLPIILLLSLCGCSLITRTGTAKPAAYSPPDGFLINSQTTPELAFGRIWDSGYEDYAFFDFCVMADNSVVIVDGMDCKLYRFADGKLIKTYAYDIDRSLYNFCQITSDAAGNIYIVTARQAMGFFVIDTQDNLRCSISDSFPGDLASTAGFSCIGENLLLITFHDYNGELTSATVDVSGDAAKITDAAPGCYYTNGYFYDIANIKDPGFEDYHIGHGLRYGFYDSDMNKDSELAITSENLLFGGKSYRLRDGGFIFQLLETPDYDYSAFYSYLALADKNGTVLKRYDLPLDTGFGSVLLKEYNDTVYLFVQTKSDIQIKDALSLLRSGESGWEALPGAPDEDRTQNDGNDAQKPATMGYIHNFDTQSKTFDLEVAEWLTAENDGERLEALGITEIPNGFYIYKPEQEMQPCKLADGCEYMIFNESMQHEAVGIDEFAENIHDWAPYDIELEAGEVVRVTERYVP